MQDFYEKKKSLEKQIVETMINAAENKIITDEQLSVISTVILAKLDGIIDNVTYEEFLEEITNRWDMFKPLLVLEKSVEKEKIEEEAIKQALQLVQQGNIEEAINTAKVANQAVL